MPYIRTTGRSRRLAARAKQKFIHVSNYPITIEPDRPGGLARTVMSKGITYRRT